MLRRTQQHPHGMGEFMARGDAEPHRLDVARAQFEFDPVIGMLDAFDRHVSTHIETLGTHRAAVETGGMNRTPLPASVVAGADIRIGTGLSRKFEGAEHGAHVSYFYVENQPGQGPGLHWHPYSETWVVLEGTARITVGDDTFLAEAGDTATGPAFVPHRFTNVGDGMLRLIGIHASPTIIQTFLDEDESARSVQA
ncbi:mannose-6-phosphate isomerase-like protein (cupin superfamily) [Microbacterium natoriense]|uniref:Mannose-6-phosphate isomerase-like protein (Cupin superfamily) n=2 Tax=Microbacterium natoriense TaxID=284570 RepID=A0AAW8F4K7_9MICO|nr:mannose-6-phosphate isomerase-like protein (cupin superfamily) [Microbacterium natoriense]